MKVSITAHDHTMCQYSRKWCVAEVCVLIAAISYKTSHCGAPSWLLAACTILLRRGGFNALDHCGSTNTGEPQWIKAAAGLRDEGTPVHDVPSLKYFPFKQSAGGPPRKAFRCGSIDFFEKYTISTGLVVLFIKLRLTTAGLAMSP